MKWKDFRTPLWSTVCAETVDLSFHSLWLRQQIRSSAVNYMLAVYSCDLLFLCCGSKTVALVTKCSSFQTCSIKAAFDIRIYRLLCAFLILMPQSVDCFSANSVKKPKISWWSCREALNGERDGGSGSNRLHQSGEEANASWDCFVSEGRPLEWRAGFTMCITEPHKSGSPRLACLLWFGFNYLNHPALTTSTFLMGLPHSGITHTQAGQLAGWPGGSLALLL